tara:strand:+ start:267 stop:614 length:348 start_codon:yes stop_codon:yes gene_type:complete
MLLRASSKAVKQKVELRATVGGHGAELVEHGEALVAFAEAVTWGADNIEETRRALIEFIGFEAFTEACSIVGIFNGLVRTADATGIPLDETMKLATEDVRQVLGIDNFLGATNTL